QHALGAALPPGPTSWSPTRTRRMLVDPVPALTEAYDRYGPVFTIRILYAKVVFALGPEANHAILVSQADRFHWREGSFKDLIPLLGDGLLTIDGEYHRRARRIMLPAFHRERLSSATATMIEEADRAIDALRPGERVDVERWARDLALRVAMRALFGLDPDSTTREVDLAREFRRALGFYGRDYVLQAVRGPGTPFATMQQARRRIDRVLYAEIARRRADPAPRQDILSMLIGAEDEEGQRLSDHEVRDQAMTLLFAGHDTTTSTIAFLCHELAGRPGVADDLRAEQDAVLQGGRAPDFAELTSGLPHLDAAVDETLRMYPPAWVGPRRVVADAELCGVPLPTGAYVNYCSYASHRLPDVFPDPEAFRPERFTAEAKAALPRGAYVPFGGGSRTCIGMRFGQLEVKAIATRLLQRLRLERTPGHRLEVRQTPTLGPRGGLPMVVRDRAA
ncbi:MAG TPA: cytochrome P450, partial [Solirubrobacteraceae bacterium]